MPLINERCHRAACEENDSTHPPLLPSYQWGHRTPSFFPLLVVPFCSLHSFHHVLPNSIPDHWSLCVPSFLSHGIWLWCWAWLTLWTGLRKARLRMWPFTVWEKKNERWKIRRVQFSLTHAINSLCSAVTPDPVSSVKRHHESGPRCLCASESVPTLCVPLRAYHPWELCGQQVGAINEPTQMLVIIILSQEPSWHFHPVVIS